jgi:hypothetical protein
MKTNITWQRNSWALAQKARRGSPTGHQHKSEYLLHLLKACQQKKTKNKKGKND